MSTGTLLRKIRVGQIQLHESGLKHCIQEEVEPNQPLFANMSGLPIRQVTDNGLMGETCKSVKT